MNDKELWELFRREHPDAGADYQAWAFGGNPDKLAELVLAGIKTATASAYPLYAIDGEPLPKVGEYSVILDSREAAVCVIRTTRVSVLPFDQVTEKHAWLEGEGDRSLSYWREVHRKFFTACMAEAGQMFDEKMPVVCEEFELLFAPPEKAGG